MRLGATLAHWSDAAPHPVAEWARRLVDAGFDSLWTPEIVGRGTFVPDPLVVLAAAAVATRDVELATATVQVPLHHPAELAHRVRSLQLVCGDRLSLGVSPGSTEADFALLDRDHAGRFAAFRQGVEVLRSLLAAGEGPGGAPPLLLGSWGANVERAAQDFDGWLASGARRSPDQILDSLARYRAAGGRRAVVCAIPVPDRGSLDATAEVLRRYAEAGVDDAVVVIDPGGATPEEVRSLHPRHG